MKQLSLDELLRIKKLQASVSDPSAIPENTINQALDAIRVRFYFHKLNR